MTSSQPVYEVRPRKDHRGVALISDALPYGRLWYGKPDAVSNAIGYAKFFSRSHPAVIRVYDEIGNVVDTHEHAGDFKEPQARRKCRGLQYWLRHQIPRVLRVNGESNLKTTTQRSICQSGSDLRFAGDWRHLVGH